MKARAHVVDLESETGSNMLQNRGGQVPVRAARRTTTCGRKLDECKIELYSAGKNSILASTNRSSPCKRGIDANNEIWPEQKSKGLK